MAGDDPLPTDPVAATFAGMAAALRTATPLEVQHRPPAPWLGWVIAAIPNFLVALVLLLAFLSTYAVLWPDE
jgi:hypothetical protein